MKKVRLGILCGAGLGILDGLTALFASEVADILPMIIFGSAVNGAIIGLITSLIAQKKRLSLGQTAVTGLGVGLGVSTLTAVLADTYLEVIVPGALVGLFTGLIIAKWGVNPAKK